MHKRCWLAQHSREQSIFLLTKNGQDNGMVNQLGNVVPRASKHLRTISRRFFDDGSKNTNLLRMTSTLFGITQYRAYSNCCSLNLVFTFNKSPIQSFNHRGLKRLLLSKRAYKSAIRISGADRRAAGEPLAFKFKLSREQ